MKRQWAAFADYIYRHVLGTPMKRYSRISERVFLGGQVFARGVNRLKRWGVVAMVNMRETVPKEIFIKKGMTVLHLPTPDQHAPTKKDIIRGITFIEKMVEHGGVYIHCRHGEGRGPTMAIAYLMHLGNSLAEAMEEARLARLFIKPTAAQMNLLRSLEREWQGKNTS